MFSRWGQAGKQTRQPPNTPNQMNHHKSIKVHISLAVASVFISLGHTSRGDQVYVVAQRENGNFAVEIEFEVQKTSTLFSSPPRKVSVYESYSARDVLFSEVDEERKLSPSGPLLIHSRELISTAQ